jgi:hypothetical protein
MMPEVIQGVLMEVLQSGNFRIWFHGEVYEGAIASLNASSTQAVEPNYVIGRRAPAGIQTGISQLRLEMTIDCFHMTEREPEQQRIVRVDPAATNDESITQSNTSRRRMELPDGRVVFNYPPQDGGETSEGESDEHEPEGLPFGEPDEYEPEDLPF